MLIFILFILLIISITLNIHQRKIYINLIQYILDTTGNFMLHCKHYEDELLNPSYFRSILYYYGLCKDFKQHYSKYERII